MVTCSIIYLNSSQTVLYVFVLCFPLCNLNGNLTANHKWVSFMAMALQNESLNIWIICPWSSMKTAHFYHSHPQKDMICNTGGQRAYCTIMWRDPVSVASWTSGTGWWDFLLARVLQYAHCCGLLQQSLPRDSADGEHQSCARHIRTARMWVEVISNEFCLIYGTNAFSALHECSLSIHGAIEPSVFL